MKPPTNRSWKRLLWTIAGQAITGLALYAVAVLLIQNSKKIASDLPQMPVAPLVGALVLTLVMLILMPLGWTCALRAAGVSISLGSGFVIYYRVSILRYLPGSIWNFPGRAYLCKQQGISLSAFALSTFFELFFLLTCAGVLAGWGLALYLGNPVVLAPSAVIAVVVLLVIFWPRSWLPSNLGHAFAFAQRRILASMVLIYIIVWFSYGGAMVLLLFALSGPGAINPLRVIPLTTAAWLGGFLSPAPAGMGVRELGLSTMLGPSLSTAAILASLVYRVIELVLEGLLWLVARLWVLERKTGSDQAE